MAGARLQCRLLNLPPEIRFSIYHLVLNGEGCIFLEETDDPKKPKMTTLAPHDGSLLLTCRQIYSEALPMFYSLAWLTINQDYYRPIRISKTIRKYIERVAFITETALGTFLPGRFQNLKHVSLPEYTCDVNFDESDVYHGLDCFDLLFPDLFREQTFLVQDLEHLETVVTKTAPELHGLKIHFRSVLYDENWPDVWGAKHFVFVAGNGMQQLQLMGSNENPLASNQFVSYEEDHAIRQPDELHGQPDARVFVEYKKLENLPEGMWWVTEFDDYW